MAIHGVLALHGYGVRGNIWELLGSELSSGFGPFRAPDIDASDPDDLQARAVTEISSFSNEIGGPVLVIGHSLGAVVAALAANRLGTSAVSGAVLIAPPFGTRDTVPGPVLRFLLRTRLLPPALIRPRFFSAHTPKEIQKRIFREAVPEKPGLQQLTTSRTWFHTPLLTRPLPVPTLVVASESDRIVPISQSRSLAEAISAPIEIFPAERGVGHDDFFASQAIVSETASLIKSFFADES
jgi:pimeloyl-ACP methyl ester carboxylesterase